MAAGLATGLLPYTTMAPSKPAFGYGRTGGYNHNTVALPTRLSARHNRCRIVQNSCA